ncbi:SusC/RagA family TonB-linked outer membrane protein [Yeosuana marina]|uniref:SusC/RagA family TonB-linked outer membrane protein n=1 Tax=Yeosuana marina TaxID=1565536 RepID=UPI00141EF4AB|nr:SusC/RagA family TonB-linked outer membrane protein [Yeosuana marina]
MKKKTTLSFLVFFTAACSVLFSQNITVSGTVTDASSVPLPGVNIQVKGTNNGTSTDFDGNYKISANQGDVLVYSFLGFKTKEVTVTGTSLNVSLEEDAGQLDEVVVTAFGIEKKEKSLGYSVSQVKAEDLNLSGQMNGITALQGQVAGLQINQNSGGAGAGADISIRGITSIAPGRNNQPLIVLDGVALNNDTFSGNILPSAGSNSPGSFDQFGFTSRAGDINANDIESISVLKGGAATALYGVEAANGVIVITTKKGKEGKAQIKLRTSTTFRNVVKTPEYQKTYREGYNGAPRQLYTPETETGFTRLGGTVFYNWGPELSADSYTLDDGTVVDLSNDKFYDPMDIFKTGINTETNLSISGATEKMNYYLSLGDQKEKSTIPNSDYEKINMRLSAGYQITDNFKLNSSINYSKSGGRRANGGDKSIMSSLAYFIWSFPVNDYQNADGSERDFSHGIIDNPRYYAERSALEDEVNRWTGNVNFNWAPEDWLNVNYKAQVDNYSDLRNRFVSADLDSGTQVNGFIVNENINFTGLESNLIATATKDWTEKFTTSLMVGNQILDKKRIYNRMYGQNFNLPYFNHISNTTDRDNSNSINHQRTVGVFGELKLEYDDKLFLSITGRNDWLSTLPKQNRSFFYPSISASYVFTEDILIDNDILSFGKLRASYAEVGNGPQFGQVGQLIYPADGFPFGGVGGYASSTLAGDVNMVPESSKGIEIGTDLRFFKNKIRIDYSYYTTKVSSQIFNTSVPYSTGLSSYVTNAGDYKTWGHELLVSGKILSTADTSLELIWNFSTNKGKVIDLPDDIDNINYYGDGGPEIFARVKEGDEMGSMYGYNLKYIEGQLYLDSNGYPTLDRDNDYVKVGNALPDFITSIGTNFKWKNLGFNFLLEWKKGGDKYSWARRQMLRGGTSIATEYRVRTGDYVFDGVMEDPANPGNYIPNTTQVNLDEGYYRSWSRYTGAAENILQDASWIKLRNVSLSYDLTNVLLKKLNLSSISVSASANNILLWTPYDGYDPEGSTFSAGSGIYGFSGQGIPLTENYSVSLQIGF